MTKIDQHGHYLPFYGYSIISMCELTPKLEELYHVLKASPIAKYYEPLHYSTYHMTVYNIWHEKEKFYPYQYKLNNGKQPNKELDNMTELMKPALFKMDEKINEFSKFDSIHLNGLKILKRPNRSSLIITVDIASPEQHSNLQHLRYWCKENFDKSDSDHIFHITLGYNFKEINEDIEPEWKKLEDWIKSNIPSIVLSKPIPMLFTSMETFIPYLKVYQEHSKMEPK